MKLQVKELIEENYGFSIASIEIAPRQFVAETWFIKTNNAEKYFVKIIDKPLFIREAIESLPVLNAMHEAGIERISWPLQSIDGQLYIKVDNGIVIVFNAIEANQSYEYSEAALGKVLAQIHKVTPKVLVSIPTENYDYSYKQEFETQFEGILSGELVDDHLTEKFRVVLVKYEQRIRLQYQRLQKLTQEMVQLDLPKVITHGDAGGNTLVKSPEDIYVIDWDGILLAPAERDMWVPTHNFLDGYNEVIPEFVPNPVIMSFYTVMYYFRSMAQYMAEIIPTTKSESHRLENLTAFEQDFLEGWMVEYLKRASAYM